VKTKSKKLQPRVFFSYAREDTELVNAIAQFLAPLPIPVFVDTKSIVPGDKWEDSIVTALQDATHVYVFWSKHAEASDWVKKEVGLAIDHKKVVIPVFIDDTKLPFDLSRFMGIDVRFVAGVNKGSLDIGISVGHTENGIHILQKIGVPIQELLPEKGFTGALRPDGYYETDPRYVAVALCGALRY